jgi:uncharacterized protein YbcI
VTGSPKEERLGSRSVTRVPFTGTCTEVGAHGRGAPTPQAQPTSRERPRPRMQRPATNVPDETPLDEDGFAPAPGEATQISNEMVRLYKTLFGRGPTRTRTNYAGPDTIVVTLENSLTPAEQSLAEMGEHQRLRDVRMFFQHAREADFREAVERVTGRRVRAFVSGIDTRCDVSSELFYLEPRQ